MALAMARPWKHPKSGVFWLRRRVPDDLRTVVGKREEKLSLRTRDVAEAKVRHSKAMAELDERWATLRKGPTGLTERQAHELAAPVYDEIVQHHGDNPSEVRWDCEIGETLWQVPKFDFSRPLSSFFEIDPHAFKRGQMEGWCRERADMCLRSLGLVVDERSRSRLERAVGLAAQRATLTLRRYVTDGFDTNTLGARYAASQTAISRSATATLKSVSMSELVEGWAAERRPAEKTVYTWRRVADQLTLFLGRTDAATITPDDLVRWKTALVQRGLKAKTIRDGKLAPIRALLEWGVENRRLGENVAEGISIDARLKPSERKRGYSDEEARLLLSAALRETAPLRRWVPWLCAYSGARVAEICQLRSEDVFQEEGVWCFRLTPEAGALKNLSSERIIPIEIAPELTGQGLPLAKCEAYNRVYDQHVGSR